MREVTKVTDCKWYAGYEQLDISPSDVISAAEFNWKQASVNVTISGLEQLQNAGKEQLFDLLESRVGNAERTMINNISTAVYSDGTGSSSKEIGGLLLLVPNDPTTGTVGGINRATSTNSFWRSIVLNATSDGGAAATSDNIQSYMNQVWVQVVRGTDMPDLIVADNTYWRLYLESLQGIQRITNDKLAQAGFMNLKYMNSDVVFDSDGGASANHMWFINSNYLFYRPHTDRDMIHLKDKTSVDQDALVAPIVWAGNMTLSNGALQGLLKD